MEWINVVKTSVLKEKKSVLYRDGSRQIVIFLVEDKVFAIDNRCPHEGYPLKEGTIDDKDCVLTCQWHNWKFDLENG